MNKIKLVTFDLDGTIADTLPLCIKAFRMAVQPYILQTLSEDDIIKTFGLNEEGMISLGCKKFDIGGDELLGWGSAVVSTSVASRWQQLDHWKEYAIHRTGNSNAVAYDAFLLYMNDLYDLVTGLGYTSVRMWNDDALRSKDTGWNGAVQLNTDIDIWYWSEGTNPVKTYLDAGYQVYNIINHYTYYVVSNKYYSGSSYPNARPESIYNQWNPYIFGENTKGTGSGNDTKLYDPNVLGSAFAVWCDEPTVRTENQVMADLIPLIRANAAKAWEIAK